ncbi:MAG TPA: hypothetical protein DCL48_11285 [Alphaproteobacteria bacterium]|nr:hypothetical protein [Alphaproteobacteria bacterium]
MSGDGNGAVRHLRSALVAPYFVPGQILLDDDLTALLNYSAQSLQTVVRAVFGIGVASGMEVARKEGGGENWVEVSEGVAFDGHGRIIDLNTPQRIDVNFPMSPGTYWLVLISEKEEPFEQRRSMGLTEDEQRLHPTRSRLAFRLAIVSSKPSGPYHIVLGTLKKEAEGSWVCEKADRMTVKTPGSPSVAGA